MKNEPRFIPDNISRISGSSIQVQGIQNIDGTGYQSDSTDHLMSQILKERAIRLKQQHQHQGQRNGNTSIQQNIPPKQYKESSQQYQNDKGRSGTSQQNVLQLETEKQKSLVKEQVKEFPDKKERRFLTQQSELNSSSGKLAFAALENNKFTEEKKEEEQSSKNGHLIMMETEKEEEEVHGFHSPKEKSISQPVVQNQKDQSNFELPKVDKINNQSVDHSMSHHDKSLKFAASLAPYQAGSDYLELGIDNSRPAKEPSEEGEPQMVDKQEYQVNVNEANSISSVNSAFKPNKSQMDVQKSSIQENKESIVKETDQEVVQALTDHLNQINEIQNAEASVTKRDTYRNPSFGSMPKNLDKPNVRQTNVLGSQFETQYSEDVRDVKILEHHYQSNLQCLRDQTERLLQLQEILIMESECIEMRSRVKQQQMLNRKYKISLRNASYSKRFNFHSPIPKNNATPLEFFKKFNVSPKYANKYQQTVQKIADEKKLQKQLEEEYKIFCNYFELMKTKQISSYPQLPFEVEYDSQLQKYKAITGQLSRQTSSFSDYEVQGKGKKYQFNKSKRKVAVDNNQITYYEMMNFKKDICKDAILQYQVFNLGRVKKLKDENKLLVKEIDFVQQQIDQVDKQLKSEIEGLQLSEGFTQSQYLLKSKTSISRSPMARTNLYLSKGSVSGNKMHQKSQSNFSSTKRIQMSKSKDSRQPREIKKITPQKDVPVKKSKEPISFKRAISPRHKVGRSKVIPEIQDDYGLSTLDKGKKIEAEIPTFGKKQSQQLVVMARQESQRAQSPLVGRKNFIEINKKLSTRTELNLGASKSKSKQKIKIHSAFSSPVKKYTKTEPSNSMDQSNGNFGNIQ